MLSAIEVAELIESGSWDRDQIDAREVRLLEWVSATWG